MRNPNNKFANPFYALLLMTGIAFVITASAYWRMAVHEMPSTATASAASTEHPLMAWMRQYGERALMAELALLAVFTFAAMATDDFWQRRTKDEKRLQPQMNADARQ